MEICKSEIKKPDDYWVDFTFNFVVGCCVFVLFMLCLGGIVVEHIKAKMKRKQYVKPLCVQ
jgi:hypothetical protein